MLPIHQSRLQPCFFLLLIVAAIFIEARHLAMPGMLAKPFYLDTKNCGAYIPSTKFENSGDFFPWMAEILILGTNEDLNGCTATIISRNYLLTAAHCLQNMLKTFAYVGSANLEKAQRRNVSKGIPHPKYAKGINDIALAKLAEPLEFDYVKTAPICLSAKNSQTVGTIAGWGEQRLPTQCPDSSKNIPRIPSDDIKIMGSGQVKIVPVGSKECSTLFGFGTGNICAVGLSAVADKGDSGGPLMVKKDGGGWQQIGVMSFLRGCHSPKPVPMAFTRVGDYCDWIKENTEDEVECVD